MHMQQWEPRQYQYNLPFSVALLPLSSLHPCCRNTSSSAGGFIQESEIRCLRLPLGYTSHAGYSLRCGDHQQDAGTLTLTATGNSCALISKSVITCLLQRETKLTKLRVLHPILVDIYLVQYCSTILQKPLFCTLYFGTECWRVG